MDVIAHTPTPNLETSLDFYGRLGFETLSGEAPVLVSDGTTVIEINPDRVARAGVKVFGTSTETIAGALERVTTVHKTGDEYLCADPSNVWIYLVEGGSPPRPQTGVASSVLGTFVGLSLETTALNRSVEIWRLLGFIQVEGTVEDGWVSLKNEAGLAVNLMAPLTCPHLFFNPSLTYFNGEKNMAVIERIRRIGIPITEEITLFNDEGVVDNIIVRDPGGYGIFVFND